MTIMKEIKLKNLNMLVTNLKGSSLIISLIKLNNMPPLLRSMEFYLVYYEAYCKMD